MTSLISLTLVLMSAVKMILPSNDDNRIAIMEVFIQQNSRVESDWLGYSFGLQIYGF